MIMPMKLRTPPASALLAKAAGLHNGGGRPSSDAPVAKLAPRAAARDRQGSAPGLNTTQLDAAERIVAGTAAPWGSRWSMFQDPEGIRYAWARTTEVTGSRRPGHGLHPRRPGHGQARRPRPRPAGCLRPASLGWSGRTGQAPEPPRVHTARTPGAADEQAPLGVAGRETANRRPMTRVGESRTINTTN